MSRMAERHCGVIAAGAARRKGTHAFAAEGGDRRGERQDAEALQDGRRAATAGRLTAASRCGLAARRNGDVPTATFALWLGLVSPSPLPGDLSGGAMRPAAPSERHFGGGGGGSR